MSRRCFKADPQTAWFTLGFEASGKLLAVAQTYEIAGSANVRVRIISARKASKSERRAYEDEPR